MVAKLQPMIDDVTQLRAEFLERVAALPAKARKERPTPNDWSPIEVTEHLLGYDALALQYIPEAKGKKLRPKFKSKLFTWFITRGMAGNVRIPTAPGGEPSGKLDFAEAKAHWDRIYAALQDELGELTDESVDYAFGVNPLAGPLSAEQYLRITASHLRYHLRHFPTKSA